MSIKGASIDIEKFASPTLRCKDVNCKLQSKLFSKIKLNIWIFPLVVALMIPIFCFTLYSYAACHGHLEPILQFVSDSGTFTPSAGYFAESLDIIAILVFIACFARYKQVKYYFQVKIPELVSIQQCSDLSTQFLPRLARLNFTALLCSFVIAFSMAGLANFRVNEAFHLHAICGICMFIATFIYTRCMIAMCESLSNKFTIESRPVTMRFGVILQVVSVVGCVAFNAIGCAHFGFKRFFIEHERLHWTSDKPGYWWHVLGSGCEWIVINANSILMLCLFHRMKQFQEWQNIHF